MVEFGGATKAPDYSFRIGGTPKFYLEAKKPAVNIKDDAAPAFQLRGQGRLCTKKPVLHKKVGLWTRTPGG